jgi:hypothetical protein
MTKRRSASMVGGLAVLALAAPQAWAAPPNPVTTGHQDTVTVNCTDVPGFTSDQNSLFGQTTETNAFNRAPHAIESSCVLTP